MHLLQAKLNARGTELAQAEVVIEEQTKKNERAEAQLHELHDEFHETVATQNEDKERLACSKKTESDLQEKLHEAEIGMQTIEEKQEKQRAENGQLQATFESKMLDLSKKLEAAESAI